MSTRTSIDSPALSLRFNSDPAELAPVRVQIEKFCADAGFDAKSCDEIGLVVNEALANVIRHAYDKATDRPIEVKAKIEPGEAIIEIRDWGKGVNPDSLHRPCLLALQGR